MFSQIEDTLDKINDLDILPKWGIGIALTLMVLGIIRLVLKKVILDFVKQTAFGWDDKLYGPVSKLSLIHI